MTVDVITECPCVIPVQLPCCKTTVDIYSISRVEACPFDRTKLNHRLIQTNLNLSPKITFYFYQSKLRFSSVQLSEKEWQRAEFTFDWMSKNVPPAFQQRLKIQTVFHCVLEWSAVEQKYVFSASSQNMELQLTPLFDLRISQDWAQNFAGKYFSLLRS